MRKLFLLMTISAVGCLVLAACGGTDTNINTSRIANTASNAVNTVANTTAAAANSVANAVSGAMTSSPESFMKEAAQGGMAEVEMGKLASTKASDPEIKKFGQMMVTEHTAAGNDLKAVAAKKNFKLPTDLGPHQATLDKLKGLSGADFDKAYVNVMVNDHESDLSAFQKQADNSSDPDVKAFAAKVVPVVKKHLDAIKAIQAKMK